MAKDSPEKLAHLVRTLNLIPYLHKHPDATPMEIARDLGHTHTEVMEDLQRLMLTGVGKGPGELIDLAASWTGVTLIDDQGLTTPLRLTPTEANALLLTLESLETMPGLVDHSAVTSGARKLREVVHDAGVPDSEHSAHDGPAAAIVTALKQRRMLALTYTSATSDTTRTRVVSPIGVFHRDGQTYLSALEGEEAKTFRFDRIGGVELLDQPAAPESAGLRDAYDASDPFGFATTHTARLLVRADAAWLADYWQIELDPGARSGEWIEATMPYGSDDWLVRFALSQADRVKVVAPEHIAESVAARGAAALKRYA